VLLLVGADFHRMAHFGRIDRVRDARALDEPGTSAAAHAQARHACSCQPATRRRQSDATQPAAIAAARQPRHARAQALRHRLASTGS
jgi:hypothetical protein